MDWAALAQQWIRMKEVHESAVVNVPGMVHGHIGYAAPPKVHSMPVPDHVNHGVNGGEAPMDVEKDEEHASLPSGD